jgi:hypothetical protein
MRMGVAGCPVHQLEVWEGVYFSTWGAEGSRDRRVMVTPFW